MQLDFESEKPIFLQIAEGLEDGSSPGDDRENGLRRGSSASGCRCRVGPGRPVNLTAELMPHQWQLPFGPKLPR